MASSRKEEVVIWPLWALIRDLHMRLISAAPPCVRVPGTRSADRFAVKGSEERRMCERETVQSTRISRPVLT